MGSQRVGHDLATKQQGTTILIFKIIHLQVSNGARIKVENVKLQNLVLSHLPCFFLADLKKSLRSEDYVSACSEA